MLDQAYQFNTQTKAMHCEPYGNGHINSTFLVTNKAKERYILQKINKHVFKNPEALMKNVVMVTEHLRNAGMSNILRVVPCIDGASYHVDADGEYWRMYDFVKDSIFVDMPEGPEDMHQCGLAIGGFINGMADFDAHKLSETIPHFHDTPWRYRTLHEAISNDVMGRVKLAQPEIEFALSRESFAKLLLGLQSNGDMPTRVTHNDCKINNVLLHHQTRKALCVTDLDTVMPGLAVTDFGDAIRNGAATAAEDETNLEKVNFSLEMYEAYRAGFLNACPSLNPCEIEHMPHGAKMMMLECGVRFLTDYLCGDTYFKIHRENHNLDRCRTQFKMVAETEAKLAI